MKHGEDQEQAWLMQWARLQPIPAAADIQPGSKVASYLYAIPNGGKRSLIEAARLVKCGVKAGVHDLHLPIARSGRIGLWIEMKYGAGRMSKEQLDWREKMELAGHMCVTCWSWAAAMDAIKVYLGIEKALEIAPPKPHKPGDPVAWGK
jgi:hypothetical protein